MSILDKVKNHISNNRGKYGAAAGAGTTYGLSQIDNPLINQASFNTIAKGQNLALNMADKIGYGKEQLQNLGIREIDPKYIDTVNDIANIPGVSMQNPMLVVNRGEELTSIKNGLKDLINVHENTNIGNKMKIEIKKALLEGTLPEQIITEAKHANHPDLDKRSTSYISRVDGIPSTTSISDNRNKLAEKIKMARKVRDVARSKNDPHFANYYDNEVRKMSQIGNTSSNVKEQGTKSDLRLAKNMAKNPRIISSAKQ